MSRGVKAVVRRSVAVVAVVLLKTVSVFPLSWVRWLARPIGAVAFATVPRLRHTTLENLSRAYGDSLTPEQRNAIARESVQNLVTVAVEFPSILRLHAGNIEKFVTIRGLDGLDSSRGVLLIGGHMANWEWMIPALHHNGHPIAVVVRPMDDPWLDRVVDRIRRAGGMYPISKHGASDEVFRKLRDGWIVGLLADQSPRESAVPTTFFGQPCWSTIAPVMVAMRAKVPVHPASMRREPDGHYVFEIQPVIEFERTGNLRRDLVVNTQRCQDAIEAIVRANPGQWLWAHRRWKDRPRLQAEWEARMQRERGRDKGPNGATAESI